MKSLPIPPRKISGPGPPHPHPGEVYFDMDEGVGKPSRWNTLRAMRVLDWYARAHAR